MKIIDFHTHAFPDEIAERAINKLQEDCPVKAKLNGTVSALLESMDRNGIEKSVICSIATKPEQFDAILKWSKKIASDRIIPLLSVHPEDGKIKERLKIVKNEGFLGIKMHPFYQNFSIDDERLFPLYEYLVENELFVIMHCGYDISFPQWDIASPERIVNVVNRFPELKFITTHLGAWKQWDLVEKFIIGREIYMETSFAFGWFPEERIRDFLLKHPSDYILFGTDSPWANQSEEIKNLKGLNLPEEIVEKIFYHNANKLLSKR